METADVLLVDFENKDEIMSRIKDLQLSRNTVTKQCERMEKNRAAQLQRDIASCELSPNTVNYSFSILMTDG